MQYLRSFFFLYCLTFGRGVCLGVVGWSLYHLGMIQKASQQEKRVNKEKSNSFSISNTECCSFPLLTFSSRLPAFSSTGIFQYHQISVPAFPVQSFSILAVFSIAYWPLSATHKDHGCLMDLPTVFIGDF